MSSQSKQSAEVKSDNNEQKNFLFEPQSLMTHPKVRPIRMAQQHIQQFDSSRKKIKTESSKYIDPNKMMESIQSQKFITGQNRHQQSDQQEQFPKLRQKAKLVRQVIKIIEKPPVQIKCQLLQKQILQQIFNRKKYSACSIKQILNLFSDGVILNRSVYSHNRIKQSAIEGKKATIFYPTTSFTGQIFNIMKCQQQLQIVMGHFGTSKTISTILYQQLTEFIVDYRVSVSKKFNNNQHCTKIIYWSINMEQNTQKNVNEIILGQFSQAQRKFLKDFFYRGKEQSKLMNQNWKEAFSTKNIRVILVVDQLNSLISVIRDKKYNLIDSNFTKKIGDCSQIIQIQKIIRQCEKVFDRIVFLSSMNVQTYLLKSIQCFRDEQYLKSIIKRIYLSEKQQIQQGKLDMIDFYVRSFIECIKVNPMNFQSQIENDQKSNIFEPALYQKQQLIATIVYQFYNSLDKQDTFYLTQLVIRSYLKQYARDNSLQRKTIEQITSLLNLKQKMKQHFQIIRKVQMPASISQNVIHFMTNFPQLQLLKSELILQINRYFEQHQKKGLPKQTLVTIPVNEIELFENENQVQFIQEILDKNIFSYKNSHSDKITLLIPPSVFLNLRISKTSTVIEYALSYLVNLKYQTIIEGKNIQVIGGKVQYYLKKVLAIGCTSLIFKDDHYQNFKMFQNISGRPIYFIPISENKNEMRSEDVQDKRQQYEKSEQDSLSKCIKSGLQNILTKIQHPISRQVNKQIDQMCYFFIPGKKQFTNSYAQLNLSRQELLQNQNHVSKAIDLILLSLNKQKNYISVHAIDITINCRTNIIKSKLEKFLKCFRQFRDKNETTINILGKTYQIELNYYVISPEKDHIKIRNQLKKVQQDFRYGFTEHQKIQTILQLKKQINTEFKLLNQIGHLSLAKHIQVINKQSQIVDLKVFEKLAFNYFNDINQSTNQ